MVLRFKMQVRVTSVDNFQGEENALIILSLVRSNVEGKAGFLSDTHRTCVALSRAKHGLFVVGNFDVILRCSDFWRAVCQHMRDKGVCLRVCLYARCACT